MLVGKVQPNGVLLGGNWVQVASAVGWTLGVNVGARVFVMLGVTLGAMVAVALGVAVNVAVKVGALVFSGVAEPNAVVVVSAGSGVEVGMATVGLAVGVEVNAIVAVPLGVGVGALNIANGCTPGVWVAHKAALLRPSKNASPSHFQPSSNIFCFSLKYGLLAPLDKRAIPATANAEAKIANPISIAYQNIILLYHATCTTPSL